MGESLLEELEAHESAERAAEAVEAKDPLLSQVTLTIAVLAVVAAIGASLETTEGDKSIVTKNEAVLEQNQATDAWNFYEAKSLKKNLYAIAAAQGGPKSADFAKESAKNAAEQAGIQKQAKGFEASRERRNLEAEVHERRHGRLTIASTLLHMSIAIATLSIILHRRWPWWTALALTAVGLGIGVWAYL